MRGKDYHNHPKEVMGKKSSPCGRTDAAVEVEDNEVGYMFIGTSDIDQARRILDEYVWNPEDYRFAARTIRREGKRVTCCVWLADSPGAAWVGAGSV